MRNDEEIQQPQVSLSNTRKLSDTNGAAARFRVKKKHKTISLERSVSDLQGRAEELEREVADLRRENGWLKEIVMLKGAQFAALRLHPQLGEANVADPSSQVLHRKSLYFAGGCAAF